MDNNKYWFGCDTQSLLISWREVGELVSVHVHDTGESFEGDLCYVINALIEVLHGCNDPQLTQADSEDIRQWAISHATKINVDNACTVATVV